MPNLTYISSDRKSLKSKVYKGLTICDALKMIGNYPSMNCGGRAKCATCKIKVLEGSEFLTNVTQEEISRLGSDLISENFRLACQSMINGDVTIQSCLD